jgi:hemoglobin-like flavoprotein
MTPDTPPGAVSAAHIALARESYGRCCAAHDFFLCFYRNLFLEAPDVEPMFADTDFDRQYRLIKHGIGLLLSFPGQSSDEDISILERVAVRHAERDLSVDPTLYPSWVDALIHTVRDHDPEFNESVEAAWRSAIAPGIAYMQGRYSAEP